MRGIISNVDIVWRRDGTVVNTTRVTATTTMDSLLVYRDCYTISPLSTSDDGVEYRCSLIVREGSGVNADDALSLDVTGEFFTESKYHAT